jgi:rhodanese-related sulfurtransferase
MTDPSAVARSLADARACIAPRVKASGLREEILAGALVVDIRPAGLRERDGNLEGAVVVERNVLEWRVDPTSAHRLPAMDDPERRVIIVCDEGYASSLAAATLAGLGLTNVTDLEGGYQAWRSRQA